MDIKNPIYLSRVGFKISLPYLHSEQGNWRVNFRGMIPEPIRLSMAKDEYENRDLNWNRKGVKWVEQGGEGKENKL